MYEEITINIPEDIREKMEILKKLCARLRADIEELTDEELIQDLIRLEFAEQKDEYLETIIEIEKAQEVDEKITFKFSKQIIKELRNFNNFPVSIGDDPEEKTDEELIHYLINREFDNQKNYKNSKAVSDIFHENDWK